MKLAITGIVIAIVAFGALFVVKPPDVAKSLLSTVGIAGLASALWDLFKAHVAHAHHLDEKSAENAFALSATSHMAKTAFDKHVEFCEKYVSKANEGLRVLFRKGPCQEALLIAADLHKIRLDYTLWETTEVALMLNRFEQALRNIGADEHLLPHVEVGEKRTQLVNRIYDTFKKVTTLENLPDKPTEEIAIAHIIASLRDHLGITELTKLRKHFLTEATKRLK